MKILLRNISILILTHHRAEDLRKCLQALTAVRSSFQAQIIVVVNACCSETENVLEQHPQVHVVQCDDISPAEARNAGLRHATGEFIVFLDDDACISDGYFDYAHQALLKYPEAQILGGPDSTFPDAGPQEQSIGLALQSPFVTGPTCLRHGGMRSRGTSRKADERSLILCNLWIRREFFSEKGFLFDGRFWRNEENVLLYRLRQEVMIYVPQLKVYHRRKKKLTQLFRANFNSGYYRVKSIFLYPGSFKNIFSLPSFLLLCTLFLPFMPPAIIAVYLGYWLSSVFFAGWLAFSQKMISLWPLVFFYQVVIVFSYGWGFLYGTIYCCGKLVSRKLQKTFKLWLGSGLN
ncbi:MAG: glycosyltransferase family 2 protein [Bdellovibrio sp.]